MRRKEAIEIVDGEIRRYWSEAIVCMYSEDPVDGVLAGGEVDGAVATAAEVVGVGDVKGLGLDESNDGTFIGRWRVAGRLGIGYPGIKVAGVLGAVQARGGVVR